MARPSSPLERLKATVMNINVNAPLRGKGPRWKSKSITRKCEEMIPKETLHQGATCRQVEEIFDASRWRKSDRT
jgi:hypothetical protein